MISIIILAAGVGRRLGLDIPKCLIKINGKTLIRRSLEKIYDWFPYCQLIVVTGFQHKVLEDNLFGPAPYSYMKTVFNPNFDTMGTKESLYWGLTQAKGEEVIIFESDILYTNLHIAAVKNNMDSVVVANPMNPLDDKVYVYTNEKGVINRLSKVPDPPKPCAGEFVGISRVRRTDRLIKLCSSNPFNEVNYEDVLMKMKLKPVITDHRWQEIDTKEHLEYAEAVGWNIDI